MRFPSCSIFIVCVFNNIFVDARPNVTRNHVTRRAADPDVPISSIDEYKFFCSIQPYPGIFENIAFNAVFIAASWVLTFTEILDIIPGAQDKTKRLVVVSNTLEADYAGDVHAIKKIVIQNELAVLKVSGELCPFAPPVGPRYVPGVGEKFTLLRWDVSLSNVLKTTNVELSPDSDCVLGSAKVMCIPSIPLLELLDVCAILINNKKQLVGMVVTPTLGTQPVEYVYRISAVSKIIRKMVLKN